MRNYQYFAKVERISEVYKIDKDKVEVLIDVIYDCLEPEELAEKSGIPVHKVKKILTTEYVKCNRILNKKIVRNSINEDEINIKWLRFINTNVFSNKEDAKKFNAVKGYYLKKRYLSPSIYVANEWLNHYEYNLLSFSVEDYYEKE